MRTPLKALSATLTKGSDWKKQNQTGEVDDSLAPFAASCREVVRANDVTSCSQSEISVEIQTLSSPSLSFPLSDKSKIHEVECNDGGVGSEGDAFSTSTNNDLSGAKEREPTEKVLEVRVLVAQLDDGENLQAGMSDFPSPKRVTRRTKRLPVTGSSDSLSSLCLETRPSSVVSSTLVRCVQCEVFPCLQGNKVILASDENTKFEKDVHSAGEPHLKMAVGHSRRGSPDKDLLNEVCHHYKGESCHQSNARPPTCLILCPNDLSAIDPTSPTLTPKQIKQTTTDDVFPGTTSVTTKNQNGLIIEGTNDMSKKSFDDPFPTPSSILWPKDRNEVSREFQESFLSKEARLFSWDDDDEKDEDDEDIIPWLPQNEDAIAGPIPSPNACKLRTRRNCSMNSVATAATVDCLDSDNERIDSSPRSERSRHFVHLDPFPGRHSTKRRSSRSSGAPQSSVYQTRRRRVSRAVRSTIQRTSSRLRDTSRNIRQSIKIKRRQRSTGSSPWLIRADHPVKVAWDVFTVLLSILSAYLTHTSIRERDYDKSGFLIRFCEIWFFVDILLNFITQHKTYRYDEHGRQSVTLDTPQHIWARYLTTWFFVDLISFLPWEKLWVKPIVEMQKRRNIWQKTGRRSKVVFKITRALRGRHVKWFQTVSKQTRHIGYGGKQLLHLIIKYIPKYFIFCKNMKAILAVRFLRQVHWLRKILKNLFWKTNEEAVEDDEDDEEESDDNDCGMSHEEEGSIMDDDRLDRLRGSRKLTDQDDDHLSLASDNFSCDSRLHKVLDVPVTPLKERKRELLCSGLRSDLLRKSARPVASRIFSFENDDPIGY